ncbi:ABC transporter substrate-binding protein [Mycolicibacterium farcinogenes]|nr:ABC transporter substrate-binding protein [Mycolicibacterium farcinogenes]
MTATLSRRRLLGVSAAIAATAATAGLTGCGSSTKTSQRQIQLLVTNTKLSSAIQAGLGPEFAERTGIDVQILFASAGADWKDVDSRLATMFAAGTPPTMAAVGANSMFTYADAGLLQPLDPLMREHGFRDSDYIPSFLTIGRYQGQTVQAPCRVGTYVFSYNRDIFERAGLDPDKPPTTWSQMRDYAERIVATGAARYGVQHYYDADANWQFEMFIEWAGGSMMDPDRKKITFTDEPGVQVLDYWAQLNAAGLSRAVTNDELNDGFLRGDVGMVFGSSNKPVMYGQQATFPFSTVAPPIPDGGKLVMPPTGGGMVIFSEDRDDQLACWKVIEATIGPVGQTAISTTIGDAPVSVAARTPRFMGKLLQEQPYRMPALEVVSALAPRFQFPGIRAVQINDFFKDNIYAALTGVKTPRKALDDTARRAEMLLP